jgi:DNA-directed RNA polymerase subunit F
MAKKNLNLNLIFPKISIERIMRIRDLFLEFDYDKNRTFDQDEVYSIFVMSNIPIKYEEVKELFGYSKKRKFISFSEFINLTINDKFSTKFKNLIMDKVRHRTKEGDICPNDFNDMLAYLSEFGKLSNDVKSQIREKNMNSLNSSQNASNSNNGEAEKNNNDDKEKEYDKDKELPTIRSDSSKSNEKEDENKIINNKTPNLKNKELNSKISWR